MPSEPPDAAPSEADALEWETCTSALRYFAAISQHLDADEQLQVVREFFRRAKVRRRLPRATALLVHGTYFAWTVAIKEIPGLDEAWIAFVRPRFRDRISPRFEWVGREENKSRKVTKSEVVCHAFVLEGGRGRSGQHKLENSAERSD